MNRRSLVSLIAVALSAVVTSSVASQPAALATTRPIEHFAALPFVERPELSPNGLKYAAKLAVNGKQYFAVLSVFEGSPKLLSTGEGDVNWWRWVNDDWLVVGIGAVIKVGTDDIYVRRVIGVSAADARFVPLYNREMGQNAADVIWIASDGTPRIRLARQQSIYLSDEGFWPEVVEVDVSTGKSRRVQRPVDGVASWYADAAGAVRMGIGYSDQGRSSRLLYRSSESDSFRTVDRASSRKGDSLLVPSLFLPEPGKAVAIADPDGYDAVYKLDLATLTLGERLFGVDGYDIDSIIADDATSTLLGVTVTEDRPRTHWFDPQLSRLQAEIDKAVGERRAAILSMDRARESFLVHVAAPDRPGSVYFMQAADGKMHRIAHVNDAIGTGKLHPVRTVRYKARDGLEIAAVLTAPAGRPAKNLPLIVMPHGGPFARDAETWDWWAQFLADRGYAVVQPNFRGSSGYGSAFAAKGEGQWGLAMQDDLLDAIAHLAAQGIADPRRVCIVGASYGGYAAMRAAQRDGRHYRCAASFAGVSDLPALLRYDRGFLNSGAGTDWLRQQAPNLAAVSPVSFPQEVSIPVLLVHGRADQRVPVKQSRELAERLQKAGKTVRYVEQPGGDHHLSRQADRLQLLRELESFLLQHNPA
jgi:dipeptidyl aminopeptidase/acylaminoacyl peptidase